jgi:hypothetical protein
MTMILDHRTHPSRRRWRLPSLPLSSLWRMIGPHVSAWRAAHTRRQTERLLESLPFDARKDIGWPTSDAAATGRR